MPPMLPDTRPHNCRWRTDVPTGSGLLSEPVELCSWLPLAHQVLFEKQDRRQKLKVGVLLFGEAVPFIFRHEIPHHSTLIANRSNHLLGFSNGHARIVVSLHHKN